MHQNDHGTVNNANTFRLETAVQFFQTTSTDLCNSLALVARKICITYVDPQGFVEINRTLRRTLRETYNSRGKLSLSSRYLCA